MKTLSSITHPPLLFGFFCQIQSRICCTNWTISVIFTPFTSWKTAACTFCQFWFFGKSIPLSYFIKSTDPLKRERRETEGTWKRRRKEVWYRKRHTVHWLMYFCIGCCGFRVLFSYVRLSTYGKQRLKMNPVPCYRLKRSCALNHRLSKKIQMWQYDLCANKIGQTIMGTSCMIIGVQNLGISLIGDTL